MLMNCALVAILIYSTYYIYLTRSGVWIILAASGISIFVALAPRLFIYNMLILLRA